MNLPVPKFGIVINELMVDPHPVVGLPEAEFIELYNTLVFPVDVENWILRINNVEKKLQKATISPNGFLILCATGSLENLKQYGNISNVVGFQGLLNSGATVEILDDRKNLIDKVTYSESWYQNNSKEEGGWSLERIDPLRNCNPAGNWTASVSTTGGTPGSRNSVFKNNRDDISPVVTWAVPVAENQVEVQFSEPLDSMQIKIPANYKLFGLGNPTTVQIISNENVVLSFSGSLLKNKTYTLEFQNLTDDCGNKLAEQEVSVQLNSAEPGDILINEVLFNPVTGGEDYVEIYNNSMKLIQLGNLSLATRNDSLELKQVYSLTKNKNVFYPGDYLALTKDTLSVFPFFRIECRKCFLQMEKFPSFNNDKGIIVLLDKNLSVLDEFWYEEKMHSRFLSDMEGVALERVSFSEQTNSTGNWQSASAKSGYGTPGYRNSQAGLQNLKKPQIIFEPDAFSPNNDGYNDEYHISYLLEEPGCSGNVVIFDAAGRLVVHLIKNEILGTEGTIVWNGKDSTGQQLPLGVYVVVVEIFNLSGNVYRYKDGVVLTKIIE